MSGVREAVISLDSSTPADDKLEPCEESSSTALKRKISSDLVDMDVVADGDVETRETVEEIEADKVIPGSKKGTVPPLII